MANSFKHAHFQKLFLRATSELCACLATQAETSIELSTNLSVDN